MLGGRIKLCSRCLDSMQKTSFGFHCNVNERFRVVKQNAWLQTLCLLYAVLPGDDGHLTSHQFLDKNLNRDVRPVSFGEVDVLNNLTECTPSNGSVALDQNLNLTLSAKPSSGDRLSPSTPLSRSQALRPPSLSVPCPLNGPDPAEVDDETPMASDWSPDSNLNANHHDLCVDPDLLNGNVNSDLSGAQLTCNLEGNDTARQSPRKTNSTVVT